MTENVFVLMRRVDGVCSFIAAHVSEDSAWQQAADLIKNQAPDGAAETSAKSWEYLTEGRERFDVIRVPYHNPKTLTVDRLVQFVLDQRVDLEELEQTVLTAISEKCFSNDVKSIRVQVESLLELNDNEELVVKDILAKLV